MATTRLYSKGRVLGYKRAKRNSRPNTSLVQIEGVATKEDAQYYLGKRVAYVYKAKREIAGSKVRVIWGRVTRPHGSSGVVKSKFSSNLPPHAFGASVRVVRYNALPLHDLGVFVVVSMHLNCSVSSKKHIESNRIYCTIKYDIFHLHLAPVLHGWLSPPFHNMPKIHLKRTPQEEADRRARKRRKREREASSKSNSKHKSSEQTTHRKWASDDESEDDANAPNPANSRYDYNEPGPSGYKPDYEAIQAELEEARFREKMAAAFDDDDRLDSLEARMNDYAHIPGRWRQPNASTTTGVYAEDDLLNLDPAQMDDEEYAEWVRHGMYRKTHAREYAEEQERKARREARRAEEKARRAETAALAAQAEEENRRKKRLKEARRQEYARQDYNSRWTALLSHGDGPLVFADVPWPVLAAQRRSERHLNDPPPTIQLEEITAENIAAFFLFDDAPQRRRGEESEEGKTARDLLAIPPR
ncbi:hypothetical protein MIND_00028900 [Mycena indigotica]|uniref:Uncharacterized protein n=1 Tax=Mycena indigotica TaxID=2126181 RepID=A0A8H6TG56_9AGAR|nr:uncharacterized protein MIND_00028900 [Mycena indigotica]KAF7315145.1 hypothetical protein MIND_00028900 [Mycena indigotica]